MSIYGDYDTDPDAAEEEYQRQRAKQEQPQQPHEKPRGQVRMAYRLAAAYSDRLMYVQGIGWLTWDGKRWAEDERGTATNAVLDILRQALADSLGDRDLQSDVRKCESASGISGVLDIAKALPKLRAGIADLDADPHLLNCANGTLDLRTRELRAHDPADRITRVTRGAYDSDADRQAWDGFLTSVLPDDDERAYLQRVIGQGIYGRVREHLFPILTGAGANGKGTVYGAVTKALGDYATVINPDLLMTSDRGEGGPEMMTLLGARLVVASETNEGRKLDAALMKRLTGGDELTARQLYQKPVTWMPSHQIVYVTNHLPKVKGDDDATWRRIFVVPFNVVVPEADQDPELPERLELSADAILGWAVEGWFDYIDRGSMDPPASVTSATDSYQTESDALKRFIQSECVTSPHISVPARQLYAAWTNWAAADGADALTERAFGKGMDRLGYEARRTTRGMARAGVGLAAEDPENDGGM